MKTCFKCGQAKPRSEFYAHKMMADGLLGKCKTCVSVDCLAHRQKNADRVAEYERQRSQRSDRKAKKRIYENRHRRRHPEKDRARCAVARAIKRGKLVRQPCVYCGNPKTQAHHRDYSKPLDIVWCCFRCHREREHGQTTH